MFFWFSGTCHRSFIVLESKTQYCSLSFNIRTIFLLFATNSISMCHCLTLLALVLIFTMSNVSIVVISFFWFYCNLHTTSISQCVLSTIKNISMETKSVQNCLEHIYVLTIFFVVLRLIVHKITLKHHTQISNRVFLIVYALEFYSVSTDSIYEISN